MSPASRANKRSLTRRPVVQRDLCSISFRSNSRWATRRFRHASSNRLFVLRGLGCNGTVAALKDRISGRVTGETHRERQRQAKQMSSARAR